MVTNTNDSGEGSLRQAIIASNATIGVPDTIEFNIEPPGAQTIQPSSGLPSITDPVVIDGTTQPGFAGTPLIELRGDLANANGLVISGDHCTIRGLVINRFFGSGIVIIGNSNIVAGNFIGTDVSGTLDLGSSGDGVRIENSSNNMIGGVTAEARNVISGNNSDGVELRGPGASGNLVLGNYIGTDVTGTLDLGNAANGVFFELAPNNTIGGTTASASKCHLGQRFLRPDDPRRHLQWEPCARQLHRD